MSRYDRGLRVGARLAAALLLTVVTIDAQSTQVITIRGHRQTLRIFGSRGGRPVIVSSGDGGWTHPASHVAEFLAARGYFVVGFDVTDYLSSFMSGRTTLRPEDEPGDYRALAEFAAQGAAAKPVLIGVSEGAGLSLMAATDETTRSVVAGVIGLGPADINELGWRWRDALIYVTHGVPNEPDVQRHDPGAARRARTTCRHPLDQRRIRPAGGSAEGDGCGAGAQAAVDRPRVEASLQ